MPQSQQQLKNNCPQLLIFSFFIQSWSLLSRHLPCPSAGLLGYNWICPVRDTLYILMSSPRSPKMLIQMQVHSTQHSFYIWRSTTSTCWYSSGCIEASMSQCLFCPFSSFPFCSWLFFLLSLFSFLRCLLLLTFSVTYNAIFEFLYKPKQRLHYDHFTIPHTVQIRVVHLWLSTPGMNFRYTYL